MASLFSKKLRELLENALCVTETVDELEQSIISASNSSGSSAPSGGGNSTSGITFSTTEFLTGDTWVDGRPIYGIALDNIPANSDQENTIAQAKDISQLIVTHLNYTDGPYQLPIIQTDGSTNNQIYVENGVLKISLSLNTFTTVDVYGYITYVK